MIIPFRIVSENAAEIPARELVKAIDESEEIRKLMQKRTVSDLAKHFQVSKKTIYRWTDANVIPHHFIRGIVRFDLMAVEDAINEKCTVNA